MKSNVSETTTDRPDNSDEIGMELFATGSGEPGLAADRIGQHLTDLIPASLLQWHDALLEPTPHDLFHLHCESLPEAKAALDQGLWMIDSARQPASDHKILQSIDVMAQLFQVDVPSETGIELYVRALRELAQPALVFANNELVRTHRWPRLPFPSEWIEAAQPVTKRLDYLEQATRSSRRKVCKALDMMMRARS